MLNLLELAIILPFHFCVCVHAAHYKNKANGAEAQTTQRNTCCGKYRLWRTKGGCKSAYTIVWSMRVHYNIALLVKPPVSSSGKAWLLFLSWPLVMWRVETAWILWEVDFDLRLHAASHVFPIQCVQWLIACVTAISEKTYRLHPFAILLLNLLYKFR